MSGGTHTHGTGDATGRTTADDDALRDVFDWERAILGATTLPDLLDCGGRSGRSRHAAPGDAAARRSDTRAAPPAAGWRAHAGAARSSLHRQPRRDGSAARFAHRALAGRVPRRRSRSAFPGCGGRGTSDDLSLARDRRSDRLPESRRDRSGPRPRRQRAVAARARGRRDECGVGAAARCDAAASQRVDQSADRLAHAPLSPGAPQGSDRALPETRRRRELRVDRCRRAEGGQRRLWSARRRPGAARDRSSDRRAAARERCGGTCRR